MSSDLKRFPPNLSNCRSRKSSISSRPRTDSSSSDEISLLSLKFKKYDFAPDLYPQKRVKSATVAPQMAKNSNIHFSQDMVCEEADMEDDDFIHRARSLAEQNGGFCLSETCENENFPLVYKCKMGHVWESSEVLLTNTWCWKCENLLKSASNYAKYYGGHCISETCGLLLEFECINGHHFKADLARYMHQKWCKQCASDEKKKKKNNILRDQKIGEEDQARVQEQLFAEARQRMQIENELCNAEADREIEVMIQEMARRYLENVLIKDSVIIEQIHCVLLLFLLTIIASCLCPFNQFYLLSILPSLLCI